MTDSSTKEIIEYRAKLKAELKKQFLRESWNPYRYASGEGGHIFDPAVQRFMSLRACQYDYFKSTPKTRMLAFYGILPFVIFGYLLRKDRMDLEERCSTGQIAYKDRKFKFAN